MRRLIAILLLMISNQIISQTVPVKLIQPTGKYDVGTMVYEWTDINREIDITAHKGDKRTIIVQLWYPATIDSNSILSPYSALSKDYRNTNTNSYLRAPFNEKIASSNLVLISPGRGTERYMYTTIAEDLASNGLIVASVDMPEIGYTIYHDGFIVKASKEFQTPDGMMSGPYEKVDEFYEKPTKIGYKDLEFTLKKITELNSDDITNRFTGKIKLDAIGIFAHSLGGRIAGEFAARNSKVKAYVSMEGIPPRDVRFQGKIKCPSLMLCSSGTWPYAKDNYNDFITNRSNTVYMIELEDFGHNSLTDNPFIYPEWFKYKINPEIGLRIGRILVTRFFEKYLLGINEFVPTLKTLDNIKYSENK